MMYQAEDLTYASAPGWQAVELPYIDDKLAMDVIVPDAGTFAGFDTQFDLAALDAVTTSLAPAHVVLTLPKFEFTSSRRLADPLQQLGMKTPFDPDTADFTGITTQEPIYLADVLHKAFIKVSEKGTEAAAATADVFQATSAPIEQVVLPVDRPFLFVIRDLPTNTPLFIGRVTNPTVGQ
jgi:serpin B